MAWVDRALATLSPADVAERVTSYVQTVPVEESYGALRRALPYMPPPDLAQLAMAFDVPTLDNAAAQPEMLFDDDQRETAVLAHFLTMPEEFRARLGRFLQTHPRALGYFEEADAERMLQLPPQPRRPPYLLLSGAAVASVLLGFELTSWWSGHQRVPRSSIVVASPGPAAVATPRAAATTASPQPAAVPPAAAAPPASQPDAPQQQAPQPYVAPYYPPGPAASGAAPSPSASAGASPAGRPSSGPRWDGTWKYDPAANRYMKQGPLPRDTTPAQATAAPSPASSGAPGGSASPTPSQSPATNLL